MTIAHPNPFHHELSDLPAAQTALAREIVGGLIDICRDGEHAFGLAAKSVGDAMLRAELTQYCVQRQEFIVELHDAIRAVGDDADDRGPLTSGDQRRWEALAKACARANRSAILHECETHELAALDAYRQALQAHLPHTIELVVHSQFLAISRVENRLQTLADAADGASPIDMLY